LFCDLARAEQIAQRGVWSVISDLLTVGKYGQLEKVKSDNTTRIMFKKILAFVVLYIGERKKAEKNIKLTN
jgi:hypothetical protein